MRVLVNCLDEDKARETIAPLQLYVFLVETRKYGSSLPLDQDEVSAGFTPLQLDIFHAFKDCTTAQTAVLVRRRFQQAKSERQLPEQRVRHTGWRRRSGGRFQTFEAGKPSSKGCTTSATNVGQWSIRMKIESSSLVKS